MTVPTEPMVDRHWITYLLQSRRNTPEPQFIAIVFGQQWWLTIHNIDIEVQCGTRVKIMNWYQAVSYSITSTTCIFGNHLPGVWSDKILDCYWSPESFNTHKSTLIRDTHQLIDLTIVFQWLCVIFCSYSKSLHDRTLIWLSNSTISPVTQGGWDWLSVAMVAQLNHSSPINKLNCRVLFNPPIYVVSRWQRPTHSAAAVSRRMILILIWIPFPFNSHQTATDNQTN